ELRQRRVAGLGADVSGDLEKLITRDENAIPVAVLELEIVARHAADGLRLEAREARDAVVLVHHRVARSQVGEARDRAAAGGGARRTLGAPAAQQPVLGQQRELQARSEEALAQGRGRE